MPLEQLTTPPVSPSPTDGPNFAARAFTFLNWWYAVHGPELNEWITAFNNQVAALDSHVTSAETFANAASTSASTATTQAGIATTKAADAAAQVVLAAAQVTLATNQATLATTQAGNAATKAGEAATSATNASNSATASANSATASDASKDDAETAAGTATTQAGIATTKAGEAATSKTGADTAAATATTQAGIAATKASEAAASKTGADNAAATATTKADEAETSKTGADTAAATATTQAGISTTQAGIATTQAGIAAAKAGEAADSAATAISAIAAVPSFLGMGIPPIDTMPTFQWRPGREDVPYNVSATRASTATRINEMGLIELVAADIVRIDHDPITGECLGALFEESRTNLFLNSSSPATQSITVSAQSYSISFYGTGTIVLSGAHTSTIVGNTDGTRKTYTFTPTAGTLVLTLSGTVSYPQLEAGTFSTSHIPTTSAAVTRAADVTTIDLSTFAYKQGEGVVYFDGDSKTSAQCCICLSNKTSNEVLNIGHKSVQLIDNGINQWSYSESITPGTRYKTALGFFLNNSALCVSGATVSTDSTCTMPTVTEMKFNQDASGVNYTGHLRHIGYFPKRNINSNLQLLTA